MISFSQDYTKIWWLDMGCTWYYNGDITIIPLGIRGKK
ncbi:hypothetical protein D1BOALGB6SA_7170 [Olavius sp. associated proteobacterium Delta 1]|nr:hypothetical protein D1BOALGB6SA_7170 [Olavius sp. associated proteobacterium Delta 1]